MSNENKVRLAHELLDEINARQDLTPEQTEVLRSFLPKRPEQVTLEQVFRRANAAWANARGNEWLREEEELEAALLALRDDLTQLLHEPKPAVPALPAGMRLAEHEKYGRCVVSPEKDVFGCYAAFHLDNWNLSGVAYHFVSPDALTFIDTKSAAPSHPEFLETEEDYKNAPSGTVVAEDGIATSWIKRFHTWASTDGENGVLCPGTEFGGRRVLRWGFGNE